MDLDTKLEALEGIYREHDRFVAQAELYCQKGCATCCTRNVTLTTLEAYRILSAAGPDLRKRCLSRIRSSADKKRLIPSVTANGFADLCMAEKEVPDDENDPAWGPCPVLDNEMCPLYAVRPMACRSLVSREDCGKNGFADMDDYVLTVNSVFAQYIEHIDAGGFTGNFTDMMLFMAGEGNAEAYRSGNLEQKPPLIRNHPMQILMVPPEHRQRIGKIIERLQGT